MWGTGKYIQKLYFKNESVLAIKKEWAAMHKESREANNPHTKSRVNKL